MAEETLSYSRRNVQDCCVAGPFKIHTSNTGLHSAMALRARPSDMNFVTFAECVR
jgi:hypothetical protein